MDDLPLSCRQDAIDTRQALYTKAMVHNCDEALKYLQSVRHTTLVSLLAPLKSNVLRELTSPIPHLQRHIL